MDTKRFSLNGLGLAIIGLGLLSGCGSAGGVDDGALDEPLGEAQLGILSAPTARRVATGSDHTLILRADGTVWAWGVGWHGVLGDGTSSDHFTPVQVIDNTGPVPVPFSGATAVAANNFHSMALRSDGTVWAWGNSMLVGTGTGTASPAPPQVPGISGAVAIAAGFNHSLALLSNGEVWAWGFNERGQLGDGTTTNHFTPVKVPTLSSVVSIAAGGYHNLAVRADGTVWAWGYNSNGELGDGTTTTRLTPVEVQGLPASPVEDVGAGYAFSLALLADGTVRAWGKNGWGQLGNGTTTDSLTPVAVSGLTDIVHVDGSGPNMDHTIALKSDGTVWSWGGNVYGQLASGTNDCFDFSFIKSTVPVQSVGLAGIVAVSAVDQGAVAQASDGSVWVWGDNSKGRWGKEPTGDCSPMPKTVVMP